MKAIYFSILIIAVLIVLQGCRKEEEDHECIIKNACVDEAILELTTEFILLKIPGVIDQQAWFITSDVNGEVVDCVSFENNNTIEMKKPCGDYHLTIVTEDCISPARDCDHQGIVTYTQYKYRFYLPKIKRV